MFLVKFKGTFGFIKPWSAVRDEVTYSQQFLSYSTLMGIEKKLFPELLREPDLRKILRYKLRFSGFSLQQEVIQAKNTYKFKKGIKVYVLKPERSILKRGFLINPELSLLFNSIEDAKLANIQHICMCRNEDILFPEEKICEISLAEFNELPGFELRFDLKENSFMTGFNRYRLDENDFAIRDFGTLTITANPLIEFENDL
jgi:hypothetical protein